MRRLARFGLAYLLVLVLATVIHLEWHFSLPNNHAFSLAWPQHWIVPALAFFAVGGVISRIWIEHPERTALWIALGAVAIAQGLEPILQAAILHHRLGYLSDPLRWRSFALCMAIGLPALFTAVYLLRTRARSINSPSTA